jgi:hypothetical protein
MKKHKQYSYFIIIIAALVLLGIFVGNRLFSPKTWDAAQLTVSKSQAQLPGLELVLDLDSMPIGVRFSNNTDIHLESGASVGSDMETIFSLDLEVLLDGVWYEVPSESYASAGIGLELAPGDSVSGQAGFPYYGKLPDGQYRALYGAYSPSSNLQYYVAYAYLGVQDGRYVASNIS